MSDTSGVDDQILSMPKGGGAFQSLGITFEADLNTGTGSFGIPIELPAGPDGIKPEFTLRYHSAAANGRFGISWTLGSITVARKIGGTNPGLFVQRRRIRLGHVQDRQYSAYYGIHINAKRERQLIDTANSGRYRYCDEPATLLRSWA
jgi:Salmonella virulence plasmid 65kDa B protein